jgi:serine/threonine-protein kinase
VAYECLAGRRPFPGDTPVSVALAQVRDEPPALGSDVTPEVGGLVMQMLAKDPGGRPATAGELGHDALALRGAVVPLAATRAMPAAPTSETTQVIGHNGAAHGSDTDPGFRLPAPGRTPHWVPYAIALVLGAVLLVLLVRACTSEATTTTSTGSGGAVASPASKAPDQVQVRSSEYIGQTEAKARAALRTLGLDVAVRRVNSGPGIPIGTVTGVTPTGRLHPAEMVTLEVAQAAAGQDKHNKVNNKHDKPAKGPKHDDRKQGKR